MPADAYKEVFLFKFFGRSRHARLHLLDVTWTLTCGIIRAGCSLARRTDLYHAMV